jgi:hypothetical protein
MEKKFGRSATIAVGNAIIWASVMLASSLVVRGSEGSPDLVMIMVAGWFASSLLLAKVAKS